MELYVQKNEYKSKKHPYTYVHECFSAIINMALSVLVYYHTYEFMTRVYTNYFKKL